MKPVSCYIDVHGKNGDQAVTVTLEDRHPDNGLDGKDEIWKRVRIKDLPPYYLQIWSYPGPMTAEQKIDLRIKTKDQLGQFEEFAVANGYASVLMSFTPTGAKETKVTISCDVDNK